jgi:hypothetical protein
LQRYAAVMCMTMLAVAACSSGSGGTAHGPWRIVGHGILSECPGLVHDGCADTAWVAFSATTKGGACYSFASARVRKDTGSRLSGGRARFCHLTTRRGSVPAYALELKAVSLGGAGTLVYGAVGSGPSSLTVEYNDRRSTQVGVHNGGIAIGVPAGREVTQVKGIFDRGVVGYCAPARQHKYICGQSTAGVTPGPDIAPPADYDAAS